MRYKRLKASFLNFSLKEGEAAYDGCETSLAQVDSISGEVARSWDPTAKDALV